MNSLGRVIHRFYRSRIRKDRSERIQPTRLIGRTERYFLVLKALRKILFVFVILTRYSNGESGAHRKLLMRILSTTYSLRLFRRRGRNRLPMRDFVLSAGVVNERIRFFRIGQSFPESFSETYYVLRFVRFSFRYRNPVGYWEGFDDFHGILKSFEIRVVFRIFRFDIESLDERVLGFFGD